MIWLAFSQLWFNYRDLNPPQLPYRDHETSDSPLFSSQPQVVACYSIVFMQTTLVTWKLQGAWFRNQQYTSMNCDIFEVRSSSIPLHSEKFLVSKFQTERQTTCSYSQCLHNYSYLYLRSPSYLLQFSRSSCASSSTPPISPSMPHERPRMSSRSCH